MRALVVYCHPHGESFTAAVRDLTLERLAAAGAETRLADLYADGFEPVLSEADWLAYETTPENAAPVAEHVAALRWADTLIFIYPTWWYGLPAMIKGWLDRVLVPDVAFLMNADGDIKPGLGHIRRLGVYTTCGASRWLTWFIGAPGKRTLMRGVRVLCAKRARTAFAAHYDMDASTPESRARHLAKVRRSLDRLLRQERKR